MPDMPIDPEKEKEDEIMDILMGGSLPSRQVQDDDSIARLAASQGGTEVLSGSAPPSVQVPAGLNAGRRKRGAHLRV